MDLELLGPVTGRRRQQASTGDDVQEHGTKRRPNNIILEDIDSKIVTHINEDEYKLSLPTKVEVRHELPDTPEYRRKAFKHTVIFPVGMTPPPASDDMYKCPYPENPTYTFPFELDPFQKCSVGIVSREESIMVCAHTSAGKTAIAEYAIGQALSKHQRVIYTSPIKTLSNQKFRDLSRTFESVGLQTGDTTINPDADCVIMTTEVLRGMLMDGSEISREVGWVIFDEVHYMRDPERGVVWEETIIHLPKNVKYVLLSATLPNAADLTAWISTLKTQVMHVIYTEFRPVPLDHYLVPVGAKGMFLVKQDDVFREDNFAKATIANRSLDTELDGENGKKNMRRGRMSFLQTLDNTIKLCQEKDILPLIVFTFSRNNTERYAQRYKNLNLLSSVEKEKARLLIEGVFSTLPSDIITEESPIKQSTKLFYSGIGYHHSGLLPVHKELVETLLQEGLIKILFATDTFAMGVNVPVRGVVISETEKFTGNKNKMLNNGSDSDNKQIKRKVEKSVRPLLPSEYSQMAGRSGRRGMDTKGVVIVIVNIKDDKEKENENSDNIEAIRKMLVTAGDDMLSQYRLSYAGILRNERSSWAQGVLDSSLQDLTRQVDEISKRVLQINSSLHNSNSLRCLALSFLQYQVNLRRQELIRQIKEKKALFDELNAKVKQEQNFDGYETFGELLMLSQSLSGLLKSDEIRLTCTSILEYLPRSEDKEKIEILKLCVPVKRLVRINFERMKALKPIRRQLVLNAERSRLGLIDPSDPLGFLCWGVIVKAPYYKNVVITLSNSFQPYKREKYIKKLVVDVLVRIPVMPQDGTNKTDTSVVGKLKEFSGVMDRTLQYKDFKALYAEIAKTPIDLSNPNNSVFSVVVTMPIQWIESVAGIKLGKFATINNRAVSSSQEDSSYSNLLLSIDKEAMASIVVSNLFRYRNDCMRADENLQTNRFRNIFGKLVLQNGITYRDGIKIITLRDVVRGVSEAEKLKIIEDFDSTLSCVMELRQQLRTAASACPTLYDSYFIFDGDKCVAFDEQQLLSDANKINKETGSIAGMNIRDFISTINEKTNALILGLVQKSLDGDIIALSSQLQDNIQVVLSHELTTMLSSLMRLRYLMPTNDTSNNFIVNTDKCTVCCTFNVSSPLDLMLTEVVLSNVLVDPVPHPKGLLAKTNMSTEIIDDPKTMISIEDFCAAMSVFVSEGEGGDVSTSSAREGLPNGVLFALRRLIAITGGVLNEIVTATNTTSLIEDEKWTSTRVLDQMGSIGLMGRTSLCMATYMWAHGNTFENTMREAKEYASKAFNKKVLYEGDVARGIKRLVNLFEEIEDAATSVNNKSFAAICGAAKKVINRGIILTPSLYVIDSNEGDDEAPDFRIAALKKALNEHIK